MKLGLLTTHPIQYQAPWFRALAKRLDLEVFFAHRPDAAQQGEGFGKLFQWDVDLLSGYQHRFLQNVAKNPSPNQFFGCDTPEIAEIVQKAEGGRQNVESSNQKSGSPSAFSLLLSPGRFDAFIVCGWYVKSYWQAVRACRRAGVPVLVRGDSQLGTPRSLLKRCFKYFPYHLLLRQFDGFLSVGQRNRQYLSHYGVPENRISFVPHFVDNEWFATKADIARKQKAEIRKRWRIPEDAFVPLFIGKFIPKKRPMDLIVAARRLFSSDSLHLSSISSPLHLLFVGSGELGAQLRQLCTSTFDAESPGSQPSTLNSHLASRPPTSFAGLLNQSELPAAYAAADVLVLPSESETWGLVVNEAMACGLPAIVSSAVGCAPDLIEEAKTGFTFPVGDQEQLAQRLAGLLEMKQCGHDFQPALKAKMRDYSAAVAAGTTAEAVRRLSQGCG